MSESRKGKKTKLTEKPLKTYSKPLPVDIDDKEMRRLAKEAGELQAEIDDKEAKLKKLVAGKKAELAEREDRKRKILEGLANGTKEVEVKCGDLPNFEANEIEVVRLDTNEIVDVRTMTAIERQRSVDDAKKEGGAGAKN